MTASESLQFTTALAALQRIARKRAGFMHSETPWEDYGAAECNCPRCIAKDALEQMYWEKSQEKVSA